jgi:capsular exopolysaccharide synthesis family protein
MSDRPSPPGNPADTLRAAKAVRKLGGIGKPWDAWSPDQVGFSEEGVVAPSGRVPILECVNDPNSLVGEELRLLRARVMDICRQRRFKCLALTSALPGEGKSTLSLGLAAALARQPDKRVLLVEADLRRPSLSKSLGLAPASGLSEWLHGYLDHVPVRIVSPDGFQLLVAGRAPLERPEVLASPRMEAFLGAARGLYDVVIIDGVPLLPVADATLFQDLVDGFLLVVRSRQTPREAIQRGLARLRADRIVGLVLNDFREVIRTYESQAYTKYGISVDASGRRGKGRGRSSRSR